MFKLSSDFTPLKVFNRASIWPLIFSSILEVFGIFSSKESPITANWSFCQNHFNTYFCDWDSQQVWSSLNASNFGGNFSIWVVLKMPFILEYMTLNSGLIERENPFFSDIMNLKVFSKWKIQSWCGIFSSPSNEEILKLSSLIQQIGLYPSLFSRWSICAYAVLFSVSSIQKSITPIAVSHAIWIQTDIPSIFTYFPSKMRIFDALLRFFLRLWRGS